MNSRPSSFAGRLARLGFADPDRAQVLLAEPVLAGLVDPLEDVFDDGVLAALGAVPDPDVALVALVRMLEGLPARSAEGRAPASPGARNRGAHGRTSGTPTSGTPTSEDPGHPGPGAEPAGRGQLLALLRSGGVGRDRLLAVLGASTALGTHLARHPQHWTVLLEPAATADQMRSELLEAVGADPDAPRPVAGLAPAAATDALRVAYYRRLLAIAGRDLAAEDPLSVMPDVSVEISDLAAATLETALAVARAELPPEAAPCRIAVIGMGKCGGRELNYVSDVDVVYVVEPAETSGGDGATQEEGATPGASGPGTPTEPRGDAATSETEAAALATGARLAAGLARVCSASTPEGTLWPVDAALRPEGRNGPLVRTLASHVAYYQRWAETWEFQALLKARPVAGDAELGRRYLEAIRPLVWRAAERENFVADVQAMRRRVEQQLPLRDADRQLKLGPGGLRDVEFSVQLLQLVHGRADERLRQVNTLEALEALSTYGYVGRDDAAEMHRAYRVLRTLEHRIQLFRLRRTHVVPSSDPELRRIGRSFGFTTDPVKGITELWLRQAREVRRLHEKLFYRPLLAAAARLTTDETRLTPQAAQARLAALGYRDPSGAMRHLAALTSGLSRRAAIQRQLLPVMLGWFADGADPDAGLLAFRRVSDELGTTHWYLKMLRDSRAAAERMAYVLSSSRYVSDFLERAPEAVAMLGDDGELAPRGREAVLASVNFAVARHSDPEAITWAARALRRREIVRTGIADLARLIDLDQVGTALTNAAVAALDGALQAAQLTVTRRVGGRLPTRILIVGMGRLGGQEMGYGSDADVLFVHDPLPGAEEGPAQDTATAVVSELRRLLGMTGPEPPLDVDPDLRPEGRNGPLVRTLESYAQYYERWSEPWEAQALTRAVPLAGDAELGERFVRLIDPLRWPEGGMPEASVREIRRVKARVESERLPKGADPHRHLKLGRGGLADVEWTVQLLQLRHAHEVPGLRTTSTLRALRAATEAGLVGPTDALVLESAWKLASQVRNTVMLWRGRASDSLPGATREMDGVARIMGYPAASAGLLEEEYRRVTRRARTAVERLFYG